MRNAFANEITQLAKNDPRIVLLSGDIGNRLFDDFKAQCPDRYYNCGIAEGNMIGVAAGLALAGFRPVCYTIAPFLTYRCMEQIRVDLCYHHLPVTLVGTGAGLAYASLGATHHSCEDVGMLRTLPDLSIFTPADEFEVRATLGAAIQGGQPAYIRIGKKGEPKVHKQNFRYRTGESLHMRSGGDVALLASGVVLPLALEAADRLNEQGLNVDVFSFPTVKPLDLVTLENVFAAHTLVLAVEEHSLIGGFTGAIAEWLADHPHPQTTLLRAGTSDHFIHETGEQEHAREHAGLTVQALVERIQHALPCPS